MLSTAYFITFMPAMGQVLRITYNNTDYTFQILNTSPLSKEDREIQILVNGITTTIIKDNNGWRPKDDTDADAVGLATAIGKSLTLRFRI